MTEDAEYDKGVKAGIERGIERGIKRGIKQGIEQGKHKQQLEIAKRMKDKNMSTNDIAEITGLSEDEINKL